MSKKDIVLKSSAIRKLLKRLKKLEKSGHVGKIDRFPPSTFLLANSFTNDGDDALETRVKRIILHIAGDFDSNPEDLQDSIKLKENLLYGEDEYSLLQMKLNSLVTEFDETLFIDDDETEDCSNVVDCVTLVKSKVS